jgi:uncharacterized protein YutE (UPF0331/DUF86 family)
MIVSFRNVLTHDYAAVDDETVLALAQSDLPELKRECEVLPELKRECEVLLERTGEAG